MKIPKKIIICGKEFKIILDKKKSGGSFTFSDCTIIIGGLYPEDIPNIFLHEVIEAIFAERGMRYKLYNDSQNQDYRFVFNHQEFENAIFDVAYALKDYLK